MAVEARAALLTAGIGRGILQAFVRHAAATGYRENAAVVELGCGTGDALGQLARVGRIAGVGIDLSRDAMSLAARHYPDLTWVVANADRRLPLASGSVSLVMSLNARRNPAECRRILQPHGRLLIGIPAEDDLIELRQRILGDGMTRDRAPALLDEHADRFTLIERSTAREHHRLDRAALLNMLRGTYRGERDSAAERVAALETLDVTLATDFFLFAPRLPFRETPSCDVTDALAQPDEKRATGDGELAQ
ncbi:MAG: methyltransferase domain-containing protein [Acidobacteriaceae bacterium]|nr:methyltransferase domain-containing protein [Acidobacteriaceae bacterium]